MRHGSVNRRSRNRGKGGQRGNSQRMQVFDSNGPDVRIRGTAHQVAEKYEALAKDAASAGDKILSESYLQHAEHYLRVIGSWDDASDDSAQNQSQNRSHSSRRSSEGQGNKGNAGAHSGSRNRNEARERAHASTASAPAPETNSLNKQQRSEDDLSLPASILGDEVKVERTLVNEPETADT